MSFQQTVTMPVATADSIAIAQSVALNAYMTLIPTDNFGNITLAPITSTSTTATIPNNFAMTISFTSGADLSGVTLVLIGKDLAGNTITENLAGPNATTIESAKNYHSLTSVKVTVAAITDPDTISAGIGTVGISNWILLDVDRISSDITVEVDVTGTLEYTVYQSILKIQSCDSNEQIINPTAGFVLSTDLSSKTASASESFTGPYSGFYISVDSSTATATMSMTVLQQGI